MEVSAIRKDIIDTKCEDEELGILRIKIFVHLMRTFFPSPMHLADLGAGHCSFSRWASRLGHEVTAFDARTVRKPDDTELGTIRFVHADVRDVDLAPFNLILVLGLFYHLTLQDQISLLKKCRAAGPVILDTQVHVPSAFPGNSTLEPWQAALLQEQGYEGVLYPEKDNPMASVGNATSFIHTPESLERLVAESGYAHMTFVKPMYQTHLGARSFYLLR
ncbi:class I SAM-dependent methyltransferase [Kordiimonas aestuarii]|uniref:class I SAM-dependent methyltransferase n=1 Tax=Kordiimonas aestuarii TaxID=1005925 RepID=UPI0021D37FF1|nr:class I SAM-dependent methyltransferase [Kordiimonas aestuarii]